MAVSDPLDLLLAQVTSAPGMARLRELLPATTDAETTAFMLAEASRFAADELAPFDSAADRTGCRLESGRVVVSPGHHAVWSKYREAGWIGLDIAAAHGGQGLPRVVATAIQECFDGASVSFGMLPGSARAAARLLQAHAEPHVAHTWIPNLASGRWGATICISEADAGSDVGRIRTTAQQSADGRWTIRGEKMWISYADHDLTERIGHIVLARPQGAGPGVRGLSLFLVSSVIDEAGEPAVTGSPRATTRNHLTVRRVEEKLGLHGSPTCVLGFEDAEARLLGEPGRGVAQLFSMIVAMRLQVGTQGLGLAGASYRAAAAYAQERRQGGPWNAPPVPIATHADVRLTLMGMATRIATLRGLVLAVAVAGDLADEETDPVARRQASLLQAWLLPIIKNSAAETAFSTSADAILIFGGAGYTTEWPVERYLRNSRVLAIYEGTAGMQAMDLVRRRWREPDTGLEAFVATVSADVAGLSEPSASPLQAALTTLEEATAWLRDAEREDWAVEAAARSALLLATEVAHGWIGARLAAMAPSDAASRELAACGRHALAWLGERTVAALIAVKDAPSRLKNCSSASADAP